MSVVARGCSNCGMRGIHCDGISTNTWPCRACREARFHCEPPGGPSEPNSSSVLDQSFYNSPEASMRESLPFLGVSTLGTLFNASSFVQRKVNLYSNIDNGISLSNNEWVCWQPNYLSCTCSYSLFPPENDEKIKLKPGGSRRLYDVHGFAMSISAVECDCEPYESCVKIVQHVAHGHNGQSTRAPAKVQLTPRTSTYQFESPETTRVTHRLHPTEHTFEEIQVKTVTAATGRRPDSHINFQFVVELWADLGSQHPARFFKVAFKNSVTVSLRGLLSRTIDLSSSVHGKGRQAGLVSSSRFSTQSDAQCSFDAASTCESDILPSSNMIVETTQESVVTELTVPDVQVIEGSVTRSRMPWGSNQCSDDDEPESSQDTVTPSPRTRDESPAVDADDRLSALQSPIRATRRLQRDLPHSSLLSWFRRGFRPRPRLRPGHRRIEWTCVSATLLTKS